MNDAYKQALGEALAAKRREARLSKQKLELVTGINRLTIRLIEQGDANPTVNTLLRITQGLGVSLADVVVDAERRLCGEGGERPPIPSAVQHDAGEQLGSYFITRF